MADKKKQEKTLRVLTRSLADILTGQSTYRDESDRLRKLGLETGPDLEDQLAELKGLLESSPEPGALAERAAPLSVEVFLGLVEALAQRKDAATLTRLRDRRPGREEQKAIAAALYRLETQGVAIPKPAPLPAATRPAGEPPETYLTALDGRGGAMMTLFWPGVIEEGALLLRLTELEGVAGATNPKMTVRQLRKEMRLDDDRPGQALFTVDPGHALFLIQEGLERARAQHQFIPLEVSRLMHRLEDFVGGKGRQAAPERAEEIRPLTGRPDEARDLLRVPAVATWEIEAPLIEPMLKRIGDVMQSQVLITEQQRQERFEQVLNESANEYFSPERRRQAARRLEEVALWLDRTRLRPLAELAWGSTLALRDASIQASDIPFCIVLVHINIARLLRQLFPPEYLAQMEGQGGEMPPPPDEDRPRIIAPGAADERDDKPRIILP